MKLKNSLNALAIVATLVNLALLAGTLKAPIIQPVAAETDKNKVQRQF